MKFTSSLIAVTIAALAMALLAPEPATARNHTLDRLDKEKRVQRKFWPSRLDNQRRERRCKRCEEQDREARFKYLTRVLSTDNSDDYQNRVVEQLLSDEKFVKKCWSRLTRREAEIFFTVNEEGKAEDVAWFPSRDYGKCVPKYIQAMNFPKPEKTHYSWLVASDLVAVD